MRDLHITRELLRATVRGEVPPHGIVEIGFQHLTALCPHCREEYQAWRREMKTGPSTISALQALVERHAPELEARRREAQRDLRDLLRLSQPERLEKVQRAHSRFRGVVLVDLLLQESRKHLPAQAEESYGLAETAEVILRRSMNGPGAADFLARAACYKANARRAAGRYREARSFFEFARFVVRTEGATDPLVYAELDWFEGAFDSEQRSFPEAEALLARSILFFNLAGEAAWAARPMLTLGTMYYYQGDYPRAIEVTRRASDATPVDQDPRFLLSARHNLALCLCEAGEHALAAEELRMHRDLYERFPEAWTQLRLGWLEGKIAAGLGDAASAEACFVAVRDGFLREEAGYDAAMVCLDLALLYARLGRTAELRQLAEAMHPIFEAEDVHREAFAALLLFQDSARRETLTVEVLEKLASYLKEAQSNPSLRFSGVTS